MDGLFWVDVISRIVHVSTAITLIGGAIFLGLVVTAAFGDLEDRQRQDLFQRLASRWKWVVHMGILLFLLTGFYNYFRAMPLHRGDGLYHALLGTKMLLAFWVMFLASALVGRSQRMAGFREKRAMWSKVLIVSALVIVAISGFLRVRGNAAVVDAPGAESAMARVVSPDIAFLLVGRTNGQV